MGCKYTLYPHRQHQIKLFEIFVFAYKQCIVFERDMISTLEGWMRSMKFSLKLSYSDLKLCFINLINKMNSIKVHIGICQLDQFAFLFKQCFEFFKVVVGLVSNLGIVQCIIIIYYIKKSEVDEKFYVSKFQTKLDCKVRHIEGLKA